MKWVIIAAVVLLICALLLIIWLSSAAPVNETAAPTQATDSMKPAEPSVTEEQTFPPTEPETDDEPFQSLPPIGLYYTAPDAIAPDILQNLQAGGLVFRCEAELPDAPEKVAHYRYAPIQLNQDALLQTLFGAEYSFTHENHADGVRGRLSTDVGTYYVLFSNGTRFYTDREKGEACRYGDGLASLPSELSDLLGIEVQLWRTGYSCDEEIPRSEYAQMLGGIPISEHTYYIGNDEGTGHGSQFCISYDDSGLKRLVLDYLTEVEPTGEAYTDLLSAEDALQIVQAQMSGSSVNAVQVIKSCRLVYLNPLERGEEMIPAWAIYYDFYTLDQERWVVKVNAGEYAYLVNAVDGTLYSYH